MSIKYSKVLILFAITLQKNTLIFIKYSIIFLKHFNLYEIIQKWYKPISGDYYVNFVSEYIYTPSPYCLILISKLTF